MGRLVGGGRGHGRAVARGADPAAQGTLDTGLDRGQGDVAAGSLQHRAKGVGAAAETAGDGVGEVDGDECAVDLVHRREQGFGAGQIVGAEPIEGVAAQFARRLGQAVEVGGVLDPQLGRPGKRATGDGGEGDRGLGDFLGGVLDVAGPIEVWEGAQVGGERRQAGPRLAEQPVGLG